MYRFGITNNIITDNGTQFIAREFIGFCDDVGIKANYVSVFHPRSNGQVKQSNYMIFQGLKPRIFDRLKVLCREVNEGITVSSMGSMYDPESGHRANTLLTNIRIRSNIAVTSQNFHFGM
jgi:transposase InsO family protein